MRRPRVRRPVEKTGSARCRAPRRFYPFEPSEVSAGGSTISWVEGSGSLTHVGYLGRIGHPADIGRLIRQPGVAERRDVAGCRAVRRADAGRLPELGRSLDPLDDDRHGVVRLDLEVVGRSPTKCTDPSRDTLEAAAGRLPARDDQRNRPRRDE